MTLMVIHDQASFENIIVPVSHVVVATYMHVIFSIIINFIWHDNRLSMFLCIEQVIAELSTNLRIAEEQLQATNRGEYIVMSVTEQ